jgi:uncharacterized protein YjiS (DUF1127 family)
MKDFDLTTAVALVITTSLASNLLWVMAFGPPASGLRTRLRSTLDGLCSMLRRLAGAWDALRVVRRERQSAMCRLDDLTDRDLRDIGFRRDRFGLISSGRDGQAGPGEQQPGLHAGGAAGARPR